MNKRQAEKDIDKYFKQTFFYKWHIALQLLSICALELMPMCCTAATRRSTWTSERRRSPCPTTEPPWLTSAATLSNQTLTLPSSGIQCELSAPLSIFWTLQHIQYPGTAWWCLSWRRGTWWPARRSLSPTTTLSRRRPSGIRCCSRASRWFSSDIWEYWVLYSKSSYAGNLVCSPKRRPRPERAGNLWVVRQVILDSSPFLILVILGFVTT